MEQSEKKTFTPARRLARTARRKAKRKEDRKAKRPAYPGGHPQALIDDLATTRKAGSKYFHDLFGRPDCTLDGSTKRQLQMFFSKKHPLSREELQPNALAEVEKWESLTPVEGSTEYDKARVRLLRDYLDKDKLGAEVKRGLISRDYDNRKARLLREAEYAHDGPEKLQMLKGAHEMYKRRSIAPMYNHKGRVVTETEKLNKEVDYFWGHEDSGEEEGGVALDGDEQASINPEGNGFGGLDDNKMGGEDATLDAEPFDANDHVDFNTMPLPYRSHSTMAGPVSNVE
ncbi:MAG: hypothetical protein Q9169_007261 [Polycauliona sp. 2 TL-2023]